MKLNNIQVTDFRSVEDSGKFDIDQVTCLVGKNESGKSALLLALTALNPNEATPVKLDKERDYPRHKLVEYNKDHEGRDATVIRTFWTLDDEDIEEIANEFGDNVLKSHNVEVYRQYGHNVAIRTEIDISAFITYLYRHFRLSAPEQSKLGPPNSFLDTGFLLLKLNNIENRTDKHEQLRTYLSELGSLNNHVAKLIYARLPTFMYVSSYDRMAGAIQIEQTLGMIESGELSKNEEQKGTRLFVEFLEYAGVPIDEIVQEDRYETFNAKLQSASINITKQVLEYWSQNPELDVEVSVDRALPGDNPPFNTGVIARARIKNNIHKVDTPFSERSAGFVWFFSFLVKFDQLKKSGKDTILLLDEPGLSLHGKAQADLLRFIDDKLAPSHQVIYSTHSPFMIPADGLNRVRIVEDKIRSNGLIKEPIGTKVSQDVLLVDRDSLFPLQGVLGYEAAQSLFVGKHTLLVEGPSDILYLKALSNELKRRGKEELSVHWTICPSGGIDKMMPFISLFVGHQLHVAVLSDIGHGSKGQIQRIKESEILQVGHFYTIADFVGKEEADIEDIFGSDLYSDIVNNSFELGDADQITREKIEREAHSRMLKNVESLFNVMKDERIPTFDHFTPAYWLIQNPNFLQSEDERVENSLLVAERIFHTFNLLLIDSH